MAPKIWRFYDQYGALVPVPPECAATSEDGGLELLWRRALPEPVLLTLNPRASYESRNAVSVAGGRVAVSLAGVLWILDAKTGIPQHGFLSAYWQGLDGGADSVDPGMGQFAALTPEGKQVWINDGSPALINIDDIDHATGDPAVTFSWLNQVQRPQGLPIITDVWDPPVPAVDWDGTLYWASANGWVRAIEPSGRIRWETRASGGRGFVAGGGRSYWGNIGLDPLDGRVAWQAGPPDGGFEPYVRAGDVERSTARLFVPIYWEPQASSDFVLAAHRVTDAGVAWSYQVEPAKGRLYSDYYGGTATAQGADGTVYLSRLGPAVDLEFRTGVVEALDPATGQPRFSLELPLYPNDSGVQQLSRVSVGPIPAERRDGVYAVTENCMVYDIDGDGGVRGWYRMNGPPLGHVPQLVDGVLYVLARADAQVEGPRYQVCPGDLSSQLIVDYDCPSEFSQLCGPCFQRSVFYLYAFRVEPPAPG